MDAGPVGKAQGLDRVHCAGSVKGILLVSRQAHPLSTGCNARTPQRQWPRGLGYL